MALIERTEYHIYEGEDHYGEAVAWHDSMSGAKIDFENNYDDGKHCIVKVTYYCREYETIS